MPVESEEHKPESTETLQDMPARRQTALTVGLALLVLVLVVGLVVSVIVMVRNPQRTQNIRDIMIVLMAAESLLIGLALIILIIQLAKLMAMLQNEIKPILDSTNETLNTLRGTTAFLSKNLIKPVTKVNSSIAAAKRMLDLLRQRSRK
ncbi:MAG: hypothetical protein PVJ07_09410 [Anaerolineales bacterium]|jgi:uncharacterized protein HemX